MHNSYINDKKMFIENKRTESKNTMSMSTLPQCDRLPFLDKRKLINLKTKAIRSGAWFKALKRIDRVLLDLTIKVVGSIKSAKLAKSILTLTRKLEDAMKGSFSSRLREIGLPLAQKTSRVAQELGNISAGDWAFDSSFATFLAVMHVNSVKIFKR
jgi:hypothetical protein